MTCEGPERHGVYAEWPWKPGAMAVTRYSGHDLVPFWTELSRRGVVVGMLDVPFAPLVGMRDGFEIREWGPHDAFDGCPRAAPADVANLLKGFRTHPFYSNRHDPSGPADLPALQALSTACRHGVQLRGDLAHDLIRDRQPQCAIVVFPEIHHASHYLWHTVAPDDDLYARCRMPEQRGVTPGLLEICREVDRQTGRLMQAAGGRASVLVFSLHGMRPAIGIAAHLGPLLCEHGFARLSDWATQSWPERAGSAFAAVKRRSPRAFKKLYYRAIAPTTTRRLARSTMLPVHDWKATRAFALPSDQHGLVRINLRGREAGGCVPQDAYEQTIEEVDQHMECFHDINREASVLEDRYFALLAGQQSVQLENLQPESCARPPPIVPSRVDLLLR